MKKILAIDDQQDNLTTLKAVIKTQMPDCMVLTALSGKVGIEIAQKEQPDTILLDIIMPKMDGYEVCEKLKADELTKHIPIIMLTAIKTDIESRVKGLNLGADAFLSKPIDAVELSAQVKVMLRIKEAEDQLRKEKEELEDLVIERTEKLTVSEEKYKALYENAPLPYQSLNDNGEIIDVNPEWLRLLGYERDEVIGTWYGSFLHPDSSTNFKKNFPVLKKCGAVHDVPFKVKRKDGRFIDVFLNGLSSYNPDGSFKQTYCVFHDITEQKAFESKLKSNERMLRDILDTSPNLIFVKDRNGKYLIVNKAMADYHKTTPERLVGTYDYQLAKDYFKTNDYNELRKTERNVIDTKQPYYLTEDYFINDFGDERWFQTVMLPFDNADNQGCIMIIAVDITEFVRTKDALKESDVRFQELVELLPEAVIETDQNMKITYANQRAQKLSGYSKNDIAKGVHGLDLLIPEERARARAYFTNRAKGLTPPKTIQYQAIKKNGTKYYIHFYANPIIKDGSFKGIRAIIVDISDQKKIEQELLDTRD